MKQVIPAAIAILFVLYGCNNNKGQEKNSTVEQADNAIYKRMGDSIVKLTFDTLRKALSGAIAKDGVAAAVSFCNVQAYPFTATYAGQHVFVRRTAGRYRNPANKPDSMEALVFEKYSTAWQRKDSLSTIVLTAKDTVHYFKPIMLQAMCMACHGDKQAVISDEAGAAIQKLYPADLATGFKEGDLRGMWHVRFVKQ